MLPFEEPYGKATLVSRLTTKTRKTIAMPVNCIAVNFYPKNVKSAKNWKIVWVNVRGYSCETGDL